MNDEEQDKPDEKQRGHDIIQPDDSYIDTDSIFGGPTPNGPKVIRGEETDG